MEPPLDARQVQLVLRRAAELEHESGREEGLTADDVAEIGHEVGLTPETVRRALEELRAGVLPAEPGDRTVTDRVFGPAVVVVERTVRGEPAAVRAEVARFLEGQVLSVRRNLGDRIVWTRGRGVWSAVRRALDLNARLAFGAGTEVESSVVAEPADSARARVRFVLLVAEARRRRAQHAVAGAVGGLAICAATLASVHGVGLELIGCGAGTLVAGGITAYARTRQQRDVVRSEEALLRFLDALEHER